MMKILTSDHDIRLVNIYESTLAARKQLWCHRIKKGALVAIMNAIKRVCRVQHQQTSGKKKESLGIQISPLPKQTPAQSHETARPIPTSVGLPPCSRLRPKTAQAAATLRNLLVKSSSLHWRPLYLNRVL